MSSQQKAKRSQASLSEISQVGLNIRAMGRIVRVKQMPHDQWLFHNKLSLSKNYSLIKQKGYIECSENKELKFVW